jgi:signal transduction histidine kinase/CheY-like chemotaxis protein
MRLASGFRQFLSLIVAAVGGLELAGWYMPQRVFPELLASRPISPMAASLFTVFGIALVLPRRVGGWLTLLVASVAAYLVATHDAHLALSAADIEFRWFTRNAHMSPVSALLFLICAGSYAAYTPQGARSGAVRLTVADGLAIMAFVASSAVFTGYLYGHQPALTPAIQISATSAVLFILLSLALLFGGPQTLFTRWSRSHSSWAYFTRLSVPFMVLLVLFAGWLHAVLSAWEQSPLYIWGVFGLALLAAGAVAVVAWLGTRHVEARVGEAEAELRRANETLRLSEERFERAFRFSPTAASITSLADGRLFDANDAFLRLVGVTRDQLADASTLSLRLWPNEAERLKFLDVLRREGRVAEYPIPADPTRPASRDLIISSEIIEFEQEPRLLSSFIDVTGLNQARQRERENEQRMRDTLLQAQKMEAIGTLAGGVAHDFNNLMAALMGGIALVEMQCGDKHGLPEVLSEMKGAVNRGAELTRQLLGFARKGRYDARPVELNQLVASTTRMYARTRPDIQVDLEVGDEPLVVVADATQMEQVLLNLFINAGHAMPGGGRLTVRTSKFEGGLAAPAEGGAAQRAYAKLTVADTGVGMDETTRAHVFEPFFSTRESGSGLGLASVFGVVKNHGGAVSVESALGKGATFTVLLPLTERVPEPQPQVTDRPLEGTETLLLVDDDEAVRATLAAALRACGHEVLTAKNRDEGLEIYRREHARIAAILLDVVMPGMSARSFAAAVFGIDPLARILIVSGHGAQDEIAELLESSRVAFLGKPFDLSTLTRKLREMIGEAPAPAA